MVQKVAFLDQREFILFAALDFSSQMALQTDYAKPQCYQHSKRISLSPQEQGFSFLYLYSKSGSAYFLYSCAYCIIKLIRKTMYVILCTYLSLTQLILKAVGTCCIFLLWESFCAGYYSVILHYSVKSQTKAIIFFSNVLYLCGLDKWASTLESKWSRTAF